MNRIKKGDKVRVVSGKERNKEGTVLRVFPKEQRAIVEGLNKVKRHQKQDQKNDKSGIVEKEAPLRLCKLALLEQKGKEKGQITKIKFAINKEGKKVRVSKRSNQELVFTGK